MLAAVSPDLLELEIEDGLLGPDWLAALTASFRRYFRWSMRDPFQDVTAQDVTSVRFEPMGSDDAEEVAGWAYPDYYSFYDFTADLEDLEELLDPERRAGRYFSAKLKTAALLGFVELKDMDSATVEIGLGLRPECAGRGLGQTFVSRICDWAASQGSWKRAILKVADFNERAITVYERVGFARVGAEAWNAGGRVTNFIVLEMPLKKTA